MLYVRRYYWEWRRSGVGDVFRSDKGVEWAKCPGNSLDSPQGRFSTALCRIPLTKLINLPDQTTDQILSSEWGGERGRFDEANEKTHSFAKAAKKI